MGMIFLRNKVSGAVADAYAIGGASPELVAAFLTAADGTTEGEYFRTGGVEDDFSMFTFSRSGTATYFDSSGVLQTAADGVARRNAYYYNSGWTKGGLQLERDAATNLLTYSEDMTNAEWVTTALSVGSKDGDDFFPLDEDGTTSTHFVADLVTVSTGQSYVYAADFKANENSLVQIASSNGFASKYQNFNLSSGSLGTGDITDAGIIPLGSGVYRCWVAEPATATGNGRFLIVLIDSDGSGRLPSYAGTAGNGVLARRAQMEAGSFPTSYIPTTSATITRAAENLSIAQANYPTADDATPHWFLIDVRMWDEDTRQDWLDLENNTSGFFFRLETQKARVIARTPADALKGVIVLNPSSTAFTQFDFRLAHRFTTSEHGGSANGGPYVSIALTEVPAVPSKDLDLTADEFNGFIREIRAGLGEPATTDLEAASA